MTIRVKKVIESRPITFKSGDTTTKSQILTEDGQNIWTWGLPQVGEELEGEIIETQFGKEFKKIKSTKTKSARPISSDPDTMLIAYAKDIVTAFITSGVITEPSEAAKQWQNFSQLGFALLDSRKKTIPKEKTI